MHAAVALVTLVALLLFFWMSLQVGSARARFGVAAPAITGHPDFERRFRIHANTAEGLILFLPALWIFTLFSGQDVIAASLGTVWIIGRVVYMLGYAKAAEQRSAGFGIQALAMLGLLLGALGFVIWRIVQHGF
jgi:glutathione S-transferase